MRFVHHNPKDINGFRDDIILNAVDLTTKIDLSLVVIGGCDILWKKSDRRLKQ